MSRVETKTLPIKAVKLVARSVRSESSSRLRDAKELQSEMTSDGEDSAQRSIPTTGFKSKVVWSNAIGFLIIHLAALYSAYILFFEAKLLTFIWAFILGFLCGLSITLGSHRLYSHRAFKANLGMRLAAVIFQTIAGQNCLWIWVRDHRQHHKFTETDADPHNSNRGFFFAHIGWLMMRKHPDVIAKGKTIDMSDIERDSLVMVQKRFYKSFFVLFTIIIPTIVPYYCWNETLWNAFFLAFIGRWVLILNITWLVNSAAHMYGTRPFKKVGKILQNFEVLKRLTSEGIPNANRDIGAVESAFVSMFAFGEGWHNYHHTFPWDYRAAEFGQYFNLTTKVIDYCAKKGWVYDIKAASPELVKNQCVKHGDGSNAMCVKFTLDDWITAF